MRILQVLLVCVAISACASRTPVTAPIGGANAESAVQVFLAGMQQRNLDQVGRVWGTREWLVRDRYRDEFEQRAFIIACYVQGFRFDITGQRPDLGGATAVNVRAQKGDVSKAIAVRTVQDAQGRWLVEAMNLNDLGTPGCA